VVFQLSQVVASIGTTGAFVQLNLVLAHPTQMERLEMLDNVQLADGNVIAAFATEIGDLCLLLRSTFSLGVFLKTALFWVLDLHAFLVLTLNSKVTVRAFFFVMDFLHMGGHFRNEISLELAELARD